MHEFMEAAIIIQIQGGLWDGEQLGPGRVGAEIHAVGKACREQGAERGMACCVQVESFRGRPRFLLGGLPSAAVLPSPPSPPVRSAGRGFLRGRPLFFFGGASDGSPLPSSAFLSSSALRWNIFRFYQSVGWGCGEWNGNAHLRGPPPRPARSVCGRPCCSLGSLSGDSLLVLAARGATALPFGSRLWSGF